MAKIYIVLLFCYSSCQEIFGQCPATSTVSVGYTTVTVSPPGYPSPGYDTLVKCICFINQYINVYYHLHRIALKIVEPKITIQGAKQVGPGLGQAYNCGGFFWRGGEGHNSDLICISRNTLLTFIFNSNSERLCSVCLQMNRPCGWKHFLF